jgi:formylglycine-generating enzyme required for sulfatase activity
MAGDSGPVMVLVQEGTYMMGDTHGVGRSDEYPLHEVQVDAFALGKYEVTVAEFRRFVRDTKYQTDAEKGNGCNVYSSELKHWEWIEGKTWRDPNFNQQDNHPVVCVSWNDALAYVNWLSDKTGERYRLPTEAEWEYAARAGSSSNYFWGNEGSCDQANCCKTGLTWLQKQTQIVGSYTGNTFGLHDLHGNVWEWTGSVYTNTYIGKELELTDKENSSSRRSVRGGSWHNLIEYTRSARRMPYWPQERYSTTGFRVVRDVSPAFVQAATEKLSASKSMISQATP